MSIKRTARGAALVTALWLVACVTNPATGERQLILITRDQEIAMGRQADPDIVASMGVYDDAALQGYVQQVGQRLAAVSERPDLPWTFRLVDDPVVNAFALPGGFIYVTRGILGYFESEAQLAAVLGHEIGHVTARHSAEQMSRTQLAQVGLVAGSVFAPDNLKGLVGVAGAGMQLLFLKYSRDDESQADQLGLRYVVRADYDPRPMPGVYTMLEQVSALHGGGRVPEWLSTHPNPGNRHDRIATAIDSLRLDYANRVVNGPSFIDRLDGLVYGADPRQGYFEDGHFYHPQLRFQLQFPTGWSTVNQQQAVAALSPNRDAIVQLTLATEASPDAAASTFFGQEGVRSSGGRRTTVNGHTAVIGAFRATTQSGELQGVAQWVELDGRVYQIVGYAAEAKWSSYQAAAEASLRSFDRLTDPKALNVQPRRLDVVTLDRAMTLRAFATRYPSVVELDELAVLNQTQADTRLAAGTKVKRVIQP